MVTRHCLGVRCILKSSLFNRGVMQLVEPIRIALASFFVKKSKIITRDYHQIFELQRATKHMSDVITNHTSAVYRA